MAEFPDETALGGEDAGADELQTDPGTEGQAAAPQGETGDRLVDKTGAGPEDPDDPQYKYWQAAYSRTRQQERERYGEMEANHNQYRDVLSNFYKDDAYALQVLRQRFPQLAHQLTMNGGTPGTPPASPRPGQQTSQNIQILEQSLGEDLAFLAPRIGPAIEQMVETRVQALLAPLEQRTQQQQAQSRKAAEDEVMAELDREHPGWEVRYGKDMQELDQFLSGDQLKHPRFGSRYQILHRAVNPDISRVDALRSSQAAGRNRLSTGRAGRQSAPDMTEAIIKAKNSDAFRLASEAAARELGLG